MLDTDSPPTPVSASELLSEYVGVRCDLIEGRVRTMSPAGFGHGAIAARVAAALSHHVEQHALGMVTGAETGFQIASSPDTVLAPDAAFIRRERLESIGMVEQFFPESPALAVEVTSPTDTAEDVDDKARRWLAAGAEQVWVVYPRGKSVTVYRSLDDVRILTDDAVLEGGGLLPGFELPIAKLFAGFA